MSTHNRGEDLLRERELAAEYAIPLHTLRTWRSRRVGPPYIRMGGSIRYRRADFESYLDERTIRPA